MSLSEGSLTRLSQSETAVRSLTILESVLPEAESGSPWRTRIPDRYVPVKISGFFFFPSLQNKKPRNAGNSPKNNEKMLSLVKIHDSKNDVIVTNLLRTVRCMLL